MSGQPLLRRACPIGLARPSLPMQHPARRAAPQRPTPPHPGSVTIRFGHLPEPLPEVLPAKKVAAKAAPLPLAQAPVPPPRSPKSVPKTRKAYPGTTSKASAPPPAGGSSKSAGTRQPRLSQSAAKSKESSASTESAYKESTESAAKRKASTESQAKSAQSKKSARLEKLGGLAQT